LEDGIYDAAKYGYNPSHNGQYTMAKITDTLKKKLLTILIDDYENCEFFMAASQMLANKIQDAKDLIEKGDTDFTRLRDSIGEIGIFISHTEKRLEEVEDCYTKLVEALADEKPRT
jgi:hypothetical protein